MSYDLEQADQHMKLIIGDTWKWAVPKMKPNEYDLTGWFDGSCQPVNPGGYGGWGIVLKNSAGEVLHRQSGRMECSPHMSNNVAEHCACANLLELILTLAGKGWRVMIHGDSKLVINQLFGNWKAKRGRYLSEFHRGRAALKQLRAAGVEVCAKWIRRELNEEADELSTAAPVGWKCAKRIGASRATMGHVEG